MASGLPGLECWRSKFDSGSVVDRDPGCLQHLTTLKIKHVTKARCRPDCSRYSKSATCLGFCFMAAGVLALPLVKRRGMTNVQRRGAVTT